MKLIKFVSVILLGGSLIAYGGTLYALNTYPGKARLIQRVERNKGADLFGESGTSIGSPQRYIIEDPKAFTGQRTPYGAEVVDEKYLRDHNIYPLQLQTVRFVAKQTQLIAGGLFLVGLSGFIWNRFRTAKTAP